MQRQASGRPVEWLSTHPDPENRIRALSQRSASLMPVYQQARANGRRPACR
jgi:predicted Zn-dependent protease